MVSSKQRRIAVLPGQLQLQCLKEVDVLTTNKWDKHAQRALETGPEDNIASASDQVRFLYAGGDILGIEVGHQIQSIGSTGKILPFVRQVCTGAVFVSFL